MIYDRFTWRLRIYWEDTDAGGVVFYANYLRFLERARTEWLRARGVSQSALAREHDALFAIRSVAIEYLAPARLDDELVVTVEPKKIGRASMSFRQQVLRGDEVLIDAQVRAACLTASGFRPRPVPAGLFDGHDNDNNDR